MVIQVNPIIKPFIKKLCKLKYKGHPKGCPNYNRSDVPRCPADDSSIDTPMFDEVFDMDQPIYAIINQFDFGSHVNKMKEKHPDWTEKQCRCVLYWQPTARKQLKVEIKSFLKDHPGYHVTPCPEGMGVNITQTLKKAGFKLEWPVNNIACQVAFAGKRR